MPHLPRQAVILAVLSSFALSGCGAILNPERSAARTKLLNSAGPEFTTAKAHAYMESLKTLRRFGPTYDPKNGVHVTNPPRLSAAMKVKNADGTVATINGFEYARDAAYGYVEKECAAYLDAIFWARRTQKSGGNILAAGAGATGAILAATGAATATLGIVAASFGLASDVFDETYEAYLFALEPSSLVAIVDAAAETHRTRFNEGPTSEVQALRQVQGYILTCTPVKIEALANKAIKDGTEVRAGLTPLTTAEKAELDELLKKKSSELSSSQLIRLSSLQRRWRRAGVKPEEKKK